MISIFYIFKIEKKYINIYWTWLQANKFVWHSTTSLFLLSHSYSNCLFKTMTFFSFSECLCMYV
jgi:hypothetical protein